MKLAGDDWQAGKHYPLKVAESIGAMMGDNFLLVSGFKDDWSLATPVAMMLDVSNSSATWQRVDDHPQALGTTHGGFATVGKNKFYQCGGYLDGGKGTSTDACYVADIAQPSGKQWTRFASLPDTRGRAGGGMVYDSAMNSLFFAGGAVRDYPGDNGEDFNNTWMYSLANPQNGWVPRSPIPYTGNHISFVTAYDGEGHERHFFLGGQHEEREHDGNIVSHYEYLADSDSWVAREPLPAPRGHAASSTRWIGCGFLLVAGSTDGGKVSDVDYYSIETNSWTKLGDHPWIPSGINTPVCDIHRPDNTLYCESGEVNSFASYKRQIIV